MRISATLVLASVALTVGATGCAGTRSPASTDASISVLVAPIDLPLASDVCYALSVFGTAEIEDMNATSLVWTQPNLCASDFGADGGIRFTGTCDAQAGGFDENGTALDLDNNNTVMLVLNDIYTGGAWDGDGVALTPNRDYIDPCPEVEDGQDNGCILKVPCTANQDAKVLFNLTVMREAQLGFFDTVVKFQDVFCAAKLDCVEDDNTTLTYLYNPNATPPGDGPTVVLGFACLGGDGETVHMYLDDLQVTCATGSGETYTVTRTATVDPTGGPGNLASPHLSQSGAPAVLFGAAVNTGEAFQGARFWNVLLGLNLPGPAGETCTLTTTGTVSEAALDDNTTPADTRYPFIDWTVDLTEDGNRTCTRHPLNGDDGGVETLYTPMHTPRRFDHVLDSGVTCPCWAPGTPGAEGMALLRTSGTAGAELEDHGTESGEGYQVTYAGYEVDAYGEVFIAVGHFDDAETSELGGVGPFCYVGLWIDQEGETTQFWQQPISLEEQARCLADVAELVDDPCQVDNGGCTGAASVCVYDGPGARICVDCLSDDQCTNGQVCTAALVCSDCYDPCEAGQVCNPATHGCVDCLAPSDCASGFCSSDNTCVECLGASDCDPDLVCTNGRCEAPSWNLASDYSTTANPNGAWSYGWTETLGSSFGLGTASMALTLPAWIRPNESYPIVGHNNTTSQVYWILPGMTYCHPGELNERCVIRWTAPAGGQYQVTASFYRLDSGSTDSAVLVDSAVVFGPVETQTPTTYSGSHTLAQGGTIDFVVGYGLGTGQSYYGDTTGIAVTISQN